MEATFDKLCVHCCVFANLSLTRTSDHHGGLTVLQFSESEGAMILHKQKILMGVLIALWNFRALCG